VSNTTRFIRGVNPTDRSYFYSFRSLADLLSKYEDGKNNGGLPEEYKQVACMAVEMSLHRRGSLSKQVLEGTFKGSVGDRPDYDRLMGILEKYRNVNLITPGNCHALADKIEALKGSVSHAANPTYGWSGQHKLVSDSLTKSQDDASTTASDSDSSPKSASTPKSQPAAPAPTVSKAPSNANAAATAPAVTRKTDSAKPLLAEPTVVIMVVGGGGIGGLMLLLKLLPLLMRGGLGL
jgi:hypothetical protein